MKYFLTSTIALLSILNTSVSMANQDNNFVIPNDKMELITPKNDILSESSDREQNGSIKIADRSWREFRVSRWRVQYRNCSDELFFDFSYPTLNDIWSDVRTCTTTGAAAGIVSGIAAGFVSSGAAGVAAGFATFKPVFYSCMSLKLGTRAFDIGVSYHATANSCGGWRNQ